MSDEPLKAAYRAQPPLPPHLNETQWEQLACGELDQASRERALAHITGCADCAEIHRSLLRLAKEAASFVPEAQINLRPAGSSSTHWMYLYGLAAAAALFAAIVGVPLRQTKPTEDVMRSQVGSVALQVIAPTSNATLELRRFAWEPIANADAYQILVNRGDGAAVWSVTVRSNEAVVPHDVPLGAGDYYWQVKALSQDAAIGLSPLIPFRVR